MSQNIKTFARGRQSTKQIMGMLSGMVFFVGLYSALSNWYFQGTKGFDAVGSYIALKIFFNFIVAIAAAVSTEAIFYSISKIDGVNLKERLMDSYPVLTGMFIALIFPLGTPVWILILSTIVGVFIGKLVFGGIGYNIFNPALVGFIFGLISFGDRLSNVVTIPNWFISVTQVDVLAGVTPLVDMQGYSLSDLFLGNYIGAPAETASIIILLLGILLAVRKVIDWRIPVSIIATVFVMSYIIGMMNGYDGSYAIGQVLIGGLLFASVFMATDPVTSPTTHSGKILFGILIGIVTVMIRQMGTYVEGIAFAILLLNAFVTMMDNSVYSTTIGINKKKIILASVFVVLVVGLAVVAALATQPTTALHIIMGVK